MSINPTWQLALSLVLLVALTVAFSAWGRLGIGKASVWAAARAIIQLGVVSMVLVYALKPVSYTHLTLPTIYSV